MITTILCPLGCGRAIDAESDAIHLCVIKAKGQPTSREYVGTWDGAYFTADADRQVVEAALREYKLDLLEQGLVERPLPGTFEVEVPA